MTRRTSSAGPSCTRSSVGSCGRCSREPTLIEVEDAHHMDEASADLFALSLASRRRAPVAHRRRRAGRARRVRCAGGRPTCVRLELEPLAEEDALALAEAATEDAPLLPHDLQLVVDRSAGNPQFLLDLVAARRGGRRCCPTRSRRPRWRGSTARPRRPAIVRRASVLGLSFHPRFLDGRARADDAASRRRDLGAAGRVLRGRRRRLPPLPASGDPRRRLRRTSVPDRDASCTAVVGERLEREVDDPDESGGRAVPALPACRRVREGVAYARTAAAACEDVFANEEAAQLYQRAVEAGRRLPEVGDLELAETVRRDERGAASAPDSIRGRRRANAAARRSRRTTRLTLGASPPPSARSSRSGSGGTRKLSDGPRERAGSWRRSPGLEAATRARPS